MYDIFKIVRNLPLSPSRYGWFFFLISNQIKDIIEQHWTSSKEFKGFIEIPEHLFVGNKIWRNKNLIYFLEFLAKILCENVLVIETEAYSRPYQTSMMKILDENT